MTSAVTDIHCEVIERCLAGDDKAYDELYRLYARAMFNICLRMMGSREEAEDVLQESFIDAFNHLQRFRSESSLGAWLRRIVVNHCVNALKKKKIKLVQMDTHDMAEEAGLYDGHGSDENEFEYTVKQLQQAVNDLADGFRVVLTLYLFEDYSHKEIAATLGISEATSKSQYSRAKQKIRELLKNKEYAR